MGRLGRFKWKMGGIKMCNECKKECIGTTPCKSCVVLADARENKFSLGDVLAV